MSLEASSEQSANTNFVVENIDSPATLKTVTKQKVVPALITVDRLKRIRTFFGEPKVHDPGNKLTSHQKLAQEVENRLESPAVQSSAIRLTVNDEGLIDTIAYYGEAGGLVTREEQIEALLVNINPALLVSDGPFIDREAGLEF